MKLKITFLLVIQILALTIQAKTNKLHGITCGCGCGGGGGGGSSEDDRSGSRKSRLYDSRLPSIDQLFKQVASFYIENGEIPDTPIGQSLVYCIQTNYNQNNRDYQQFVDIVNKRCPHYDGQSEPIDYFKQTINCVQNINAPKQSVKTSFIATFQCVVDQDDKKQDQFQKKRSRLKNQ